MENIKQKFINLVNTHGFKNELEIWDYNCELEGSTIDKIKVCGNDVLFYFDENTGDCDTFEEFKLKGLNKFYNDLSKAIKDYLDNYIDDFGNVGEGNSARHDMCF